MFSILGASELLSPAILLYPPGDSLRQAKQITHSLHCLGQNRSLLLQFLDFLRIGWPRGFNTVHCTWVQLHQTLKSYQEPFMSQGNLAFTTQKIYRKCSPIQNIVCKSLQTESGLENSEAESESGLSHCTAPGVLSPDPPYSGSGLGRSRTSWLLGVGDLKQNILQLLGDFKFGFQFNFCCQQNSKAWFGQCQKSMTTYK